MEYKLKPWSHQLDVLKVIENNDVNAYALFHDMGAGKTKTAIEILRQKCAKEQRLLKTLIICPIVVMENWKREIEMHSYIDQSDIVVVDGRTKPNGKKVKTAQLKLKKAQLESFKDIFIINTESVGNANLWPLVMGMGFEFLIVDESHRFKSYNATRTKALHKLCNQANLRYRFILTGSPVLQDAQDLWSQFYILDPNVLGANFFSFRAKYFYDVNAHMPSHVHFPKYVAKNRTYYKRIGLEYNDDVADLNKIIYQHASRVMKDDVLDLPPFVTQKIEVPFSTEQARIYKEMRDDLVAHLDRPAVPINLDTLIDGTDFKELLDDTGVMSADLAIVKTLRLMQLVAGVFTNEQGVNTELKTERSKILRGLLEELCSNKENKIIVWSVFKPTYKVISDICTELGVNFTMLTGLQDKDEKVANIDAFNTDKEVQVLIANQGAGGTGTNLTASNYSIYYSRSFNLEHDLQSEARNYRGGQTRKVTRIDLVTPESIDEQVLEVLRLKKANAEDILEVKNISREELLSLI